MSAGIVKLAEIPINMYATAPQQQSLLDTAEWFLHSFNDSLPMTQVWFTNWKDLRITASSVRRAIGRRQQADIIFNGLTVEKHPQRVKLHIGKLDRIDST